MQTQLFSNDIGNNLLPYNGEAYYYPHFFPLATAQTLMQQLIQEIAWKQEPIYIFGKQVMQPRLTALYGNSGIAYGYSGITMQPMPWSPALQLIKAEVEKIVPQSFTTALLNWYRNGQDSMGWHRDNEKELGPTPIIASVSLGAERKFSFRDYYNKKVTQHLLLQNGSLLLMKGVTNHFWEHQLPKTAKILHDRINITFRIIQPNSK